MLVSRDDLELEECQRTSGLAGWESSVMGNEAGGMGSYNRNQHELDGIPVLLAGERTSGIPNNVSLLAETMFFTPNFLAASNTLYVEITLFSNVF